MFTRMRGMTVPPLHSEPRDYAREYLDISNHQYKHSGIIIPIADAVCMNNRRTLSQSLCSAPISLNSFTPNPSKSDVIHHPGEIRSRFGGLFTKS